MLTEYDQAMLMIPLNGRDGLVVGLGFRLGIRLCFVALRGIALLRLVATTAYQATENDQAQ